MNLNKFSKVKTSVFIVTKQFFIVFILFSVVSACKSSKTTVADATINNTLATDSTVNPKNRNKQAATYYYRETPRRVNNLKHMKLDVRFDYKKRRMHGKANIWLEPHFYPTDSLTLDAKHMDVKYVNLVKNGKNIPLSFSYDSLLLKIKLDKTYKQNDKYEVFIEYNSKTYELPSPRKRWPDADRGLFFINHDLSNTDKPQQIWTQGQTESNSYWFPTIDAPNQRFTHDIFITVDNRFKTLSNGKMVATLLNIDTTRTDHWSMDTPHAPYLVMMAVGDYAIVKDSWRNVPLFYYVEPEYEQYAKDIFRHTPEMMTFLSELFSVDYPWSKYAQIIVRDYISGAMENTSATIFGDFIQKTDKQLIDGNNDDIIVHELCHQWFGDYVTCESWSNLTLNEAFATYAEYLWHEYKYGKENADQYLYNMKNAYLNEARNENKNLVRFFYKTPDDMFDMHSYNKGALILHQLRNLIGDDAFFASLNYYLEQNKFSSTEVHNLRLAFEHITGMDLNWYFNQWFLAKGHPILKISHNYTDDNKTMIVKIEQMQDESQIPIFKIPTSIDIYIKNKKISFPITIIDKKQDFTFMVDEKPDLLIFDPQKSVVCEIIKVETNDEYQLQFYNSTSFADKYAALMALSKTDSPKSRQVFYDALEMETLRGYAIAEFNFEKSNEDKIFVSKLKNIVFNERNSFVRASALKRLSDFNIKDISNIIEKIIVTDNSPLLKNIACRALDKLTTDEKMKIVDNPDVQLQVPVFCLYIYSILGDVSKKNNFELHINNLQAYERERVMELYTDFVLRFDDSIVKDAIVLFSKTARQDVSPNIRRQATLMLLRISKYYFNKGNVNTSATANTHNITGQKIQDTIEIIIQNEKDLTLKNYYREIF